MHPMIESYVSDRLRDPELLDDNEETGNLCDDSAHGLPEQMKLMLSDCGQQAWAQSVESFQVKPTNRERYSVPHATRNPDIIQDCKLAIEDPAVMILDPPPRPKGAVRFLTEPGSLDTSWGGITASTYQGVWRRRLVASASAALIDVYVLCLA